MNEHDKLARAVEAALHAAGLSVANQSGIGVGVDVADQGHDRERVVMLTWASDDDGDEPQILLPAVAEVLRTRGSRDGLSEAASWLRSDWRPAGTALSPAAGDARSPAMRRIGEAKDLVDQAKGALYEAWNGTGTPRAE